ncbi:MAG: hypothetical protein IKE42_29675 [Aquamicrobium sp.]|uniref:HipA family kinase n=1 Tax=Mesorhizobium sp. Pch-S TaxID=2082387 RepID=UPI0010120D0F|nr:HipA family kinase [Mesorhizobium sp. Pch-S]MBR2692046.1 hypothetical protein [Aquamicrobium sp.]QAZ42593.1 hypothetical protein C1M53_06070 [Mesorhizobium sp. Pch-S]
MAIEIEEVLGRSEQGITEPYICRSLEGDLYYVKGKGANYDSLIKEWIAGCLGRFLGLPIPTFSLMEMPRELYELGRHNLLKDLGYGTLFGSKQMPDVNELSFLNIAKLDDNLKRDIAAFDWWIMNGDRTLTETGGNPNILWSEVDSRPYIIDHNLAFDRTVTLHSQLDSHIFAASLAEICDTPALQTHYNQRFGEALVKLPGIIQDIPERWHYLDDALTAESPFHIDVIEEALTRYPMKPFWKRT